MLNKVLKEVVDLCDPVAVYLFGSAVRGEIYNDLDFFVVLGDDNDVECTYRKLEEAQLCEDNDFVIRTVSEFRNKMHQFGEIDLIVRIEGKLLFGEDVT